GKTGTTCLTYNLNLPSGNQTGQLNVGDLLRFPLKADEEATITITPERGWDVGSGVGQELNATVKGGEAGLVLDGRGRPIIFPEDSTERVAQISKWSNVLELYPENT
ncbi:MAG: methylaspartate mutase, partial [Candidatus Latescibacteria bacterium]|nr:methylaspartate mutase [Candidatus Latescibacterota bacterium]